MRRRLTTATLCILLAAFSAIACGGGGNSRSVTTPGPSGSFAASFTPDDPAPGNNTVALAQAPGGGGDLVTVNVGVTGVQDVFGASFRIAYDDAVVDFENWSPGSFLESGGNSVLYQVAVVTPGVVEVGVSCAACPSGLDAVSTETLVQMIFRAAGSGNSPLTFVAADLLDSQSPPAPIAGVSWAGGTVVSQ